MARPGLTGHRKFRRLAQSLGSAICARGVLELLWEACYENGDDYLGTAVDIDQAVGWVGERGIVALALVQAGLPEGHGFIEPIDPELGQPPQAIRYRVHDLWHHAPDYVMKRYKREQERRLRTVPVSAERRRTAPNGGQWTPSLASQPGVDRTPAPAPAPAPAPNPPTEDSAVTQMRVPTPAAVLEFPTIGKGPHVWALTVAQIADWQTCYPGIDVEAECRKALAWVKANQAKTAKGMPTFLVNWLNRATQRGGMRPVSAWAATGTEGRGRTGAPAAGKYDGLERDNE